MRYVYLFLLHNEFVILMLYVYALCHKKKDALIKSISFIQLMVPAAGLEPARIIHPPDFESGTSTNFITRGMHYLTRRKIMIS